MTVRLLILGAGLMARNHAQGFAGLPGARVVAVADRNEAAAREFAKAHDIPNVFASLDAALDWGGFDAAANVTPDAVHHPTTMQLIAAGKHVLCEKPLATNAADAAEMAQAAQAAGIANMVNLSYRQGPAMRHAATLVRDGAIGPVRFFEASYLQSWLTQPAWGDWRTEPGWLWRLSTAHGSKGVLGDVGIHILDFATHVAGAAVADVTCRLTTFPKTAGPEAAAYTLDANDSALMTVALTGGATGTVTATRYATGHLNDLYLRLHGEAGGLDVRFENGESTLRICRSPNLETATWEAVAAPPVPTNYAAFVAAIENGTAADPGFVRGAELQAVLDAAERSDADSGRRVALP